MANDIPRVRVDDPQESLLKALDGSGAVIVEGLLDPDLLTRLNTELDPWVDAAAEAPPCVNAGVEWFMGAQTRHMTGLAAKSRSFATEVLCHPLLLAVCDAILLPSCARYQLNVAHLLDRGPGSELQLLHRDQLVWNDVPEPHPELQLASVIALEDCSPENGATRVIPGSHRWPAERAVRLVNAPSLEYSCATSRTSPRPRAGLP